MARPPILVTGMPRSGTTWLARLLATAPGTALAGREPMNPRGRQYGLAGTVAGWTELTDPTPKQRRVLRAAYRGLTPFVYSRYGARQWAAALPGTRLVMKDPFAVLSVPAVRAVTGASAALLYRHPGAALASYRRMGWTPDLDELAPVLTAHRARVGTSGPPLPPDDAGTPAAEAMGLFWSALYEIALDNVLGPSGAAPAGVVVVAHEELATGGNAAGRALFAALDLDWSPASERAVAGESGTRAPGLHQSLGRSPGEVAAEWRAQLSDDEIGVIETASAGVRARLDAARVVLPAS